MKGNTYIDEFLGVVGFLSHSQKVPIDKGYILVSRKILDNMLNRNLYDTVEQKPCGFSGDAPGAACQRSSR